MQHIKNIIFDLGGVIINLDINQTIQEFNRLSYMPFEAIYTQAEQSDIFNKFDKGIISSEEFFLEIRKYLRYEGSEIELLKAWNCNVAGRSRKKIKCTCKNKTKLQYFFTE
jgi:putative hydrolase of the HAD superfamily